MDNRLVIKPWKVELVNRHFKEDNKESFQESDVSGLQGQGCTGGSPVVRVCRPKLISKLKSPTGDGKDDVTRSTSEPAFLVCRPKIIKDWRMFPIRQIVQDEKDRGRKCVSVLLKSSSSSLPAERAMKLSERVRVVEELSSKYPVRYEGKSENSKRSEARLDFCFQSATDAQRFFQVCESIVHRESRHLSNTLSGNQKRFRF